MEDLIPFLIFIVIAIVNFVKYAAEKGGKKKSKPAPSQQEGPKKQPSSIEEFFEDLASKFEPKPTEVADWPEEYERPDYMKEMEEFDGSETAVFEAEETAEIIPMPKPESTPAPVTWQESGEALEIQRMDQVASLKSAILSVPTLFSSSKSMRISTPPILRSSTGRIDFPLKEKAALRKAVLANLVFSQPRAYDKSFENTVIR